MKVVRLHADEYHVKFLPPLVKFSPTRGSLLDTCTSVKVKSCSLHSISYPLSDNDKFVQLDYLSNDRNAWISIEVLVTGWCVWLLKKLLVLGGSLQLSLSTMFGFGYDHLNDDYKVVLAKSVSSYGRLDKGVIVYSLKTNSWRKIEDFRETICHQGLGKFVKGVLHWTVMGMRGDVSASTIVSFDLGNETCGEIPQPNYGNGGFRRMPLFCWISY